MDVMGIATALSAGLVGAALGAAVTWRVIGNRAAARHARLVAAAREQVAASTQNARAVNARLQAELEKEKLSARERQAAFAAEQPRGAAARCPPMASPTAAALR
jgi:kynureninase